MLTPSDLSEDKVIALRPPSQVMQLERLGAFHQTRLSFLRTMLRRLRREAWHIKRSAWVFDEKGVGHALYTASGPQRSYTLVAFGHDLDPAMRSDRVIAEQWDATFTLFDGEPTEQDIHRLRKQVPLQEAGRVSEKELTLSRANRSGRLFDHVVQCLAGGQQPEATDLDAVGYLMRTTAVYGSGKFGALDREFIAGRPELAAPFQAEMLTVYLIRAFTVDLVNHLAAVRAPATAVALAPELRKRLGVGNATGLGMAPFLVNHPALLHQWIHARETALATVRCLPTISSQQLDHLQAVVRRQRELINSWPAGDSAQAERREQLLREFEQFSVKVTRVAATEADHPIDHLFSWVQENLSTPGQELVVSLLLEPFGDLVDDLADNMSVDESASFAINGRQTIAELSAALDRHYAFVRNIDFDNPAEQTRFWYVSQEKLEPRLGERFKEAGAELEEPLAIARDIQALMARVEQSEPEERVAALVLESPDMRHVVRRVQIAAQYPYSEIHGNLIGEHMTPLDLLRCKLSFLGATRFDPRSDRWVRVTFFQFAPFPDELTRQ